MEQPFSVGDRHIAQIRSNGRMAWQVIELQLKIAGVRLLARPVPS